MRWWRLHDPQRHPGRGSWGKRYTSSEVLNRYTANPEHRCDALVRLPTRSDKTFLTGDDLTAKVLHGPS